MLRRHLAKMWHIPVIFLVVARDLKTFGEWLGPACIGDAAESPHTGLAICALSKYTFVFI